MIQAAVLGLAGPLGVGKTTAADAIALALEQMRPNVQVVRVSFALPLRGVCAGLCPELGRRWFSPKQEDKQSPLPQHWQELTGWKTIREMLIGVGTHCMRAGAPDVWVAATMSMLQEEVSLRPVPNEWLWFLFDDIRFENEARFIRSLPNGKMVHLARAGVEYSKANPTEMGVSVQQEDTMCLLSGGLPALPELAKYIIKNHRLGARLFQDYQDRKGSQ